MGLAGAPVWMALPLRSNAPLGERGASHRGGTALLTSTRPWVDVGFARSMEVVNGFA